MLRGLSLRDRRRVELVPAYFQNSCTDCGFVVTRMVISIHLGIDISHEELTEIAETESLWTIDIALILAHFNLSFTFYTLNKNPEAGYEELGFYEDVEKEELMRVQHRFAAADVNGVRIWKKSLSAIDDVGGMLNRRGCTTMAIALVNSNVLDLVANDSIPEARCGFHGHYILVIGYSEELQKFFYRDPASASPVSFLSADEFDRARKCNGTDEDFILVDFRESKNFL